MSEQEKSDMAEILSSVKAAHEKAQTKSRYYFARFVEQGNDADRLLGNKFGACAIDMLKTIERLEKVLTA